MAKQLKRRWYKIVAPQLFNKVEVGETTSAEPEKLKGKSLKANMFTLTNEMRKQSTEVSLLIEDVKGDTAETSITGMRLLPASIRRFVRKRRTRLDENLKVVTKDEKVVTLKVILLTINNVQGSVEAALHTELRRLLYKKASQSSYEDLTTLIVTGKLGRELKDKLKKIYPLRTCEVREFKLERFVKAADLRKIKATAKKTPKEKPVEPEEEPIAAE